MNYLPNFTVICKQDQQLAESIPILIRIEMRTKNDFNVVAGVTDWSGSLSILGSVLEKEIASIQELFPSDYAAITGTDSAYSGEIFVHAMTRQEVQNALRAHDFFSSEITYPPSYRSNLETGYQELLKSSPRRMDVEIKNIVDGTLTTRITSGSSAFPAMVAGGH